MTAGQTDVNLSLAALEEAQVSPQDFPLTLRSGNVVRLGVKVQRYLADEFGLGDGPFPAELPIGPQVALARALPYAERDNLAAGKSGKKAIIFTADLARALGHDPGEMERKYKTPASRFRPRR